MTDYLSVNKTAAIKGLFILVVFFSHFNSNLTYTAPMDLVYYHYYSKIGQRMVTLFLFYSGYGIMESIKRKQNAYVKRMPVHRILRVLFQFDLAVLLFALLNLVLGYPPSLGSLVKALLAWESIGNSCWYIFAILIMYLFTYAAFSVSRRAKSPWPGVTIALVLTCAYVTVFKLTGVKERCWYDTVLLYNLGMIWSLVREKAERYINHNLFTWLVCFLVAAGAALLTMKFAYVRFLVYEASMISFAAAFLLLTMRVSFYNPALVWCGEHLFEIYILQRLPMSALKALGLAENHVYLYFATCFVITMVLAAGYKKAAGWLWQRMTARNS